MAPHSSTLAWKIPWTEERGGLQSMGVIKSRRWLSDFTFTFHFHALEKEIAPHSSVVAWRIPGTGEPGGLPSMGLHGVGHDWSDLAAAARALRISVSFFLFIIEVSGVQHYRVTSVCITKCSSSQVWLLFIIIQLTPFTHFAHYLIHFPLVTTNLISVFMSF